MVPKAQEYTMEEKHDSKEQAWQLEQDAESASKEAKRANWK